MIRFSLKVLKRKQQKQFFKSIAKKEIDRFQRFRTFAKKNKFFPDEQVDEMMDDQIKRVKSELIRENIAGNLYAVSEFTEDRVNQSELLLLVTEEISDGFGFAVGTRCFAPHVRDKLL